MRGDSLLGVSMQAVSLDGVPIGVSLIEDLLVEVSLGDCFAGNSLSMLISLMMNHDEKLLRVDLEMKSCSSCAME